MKSKKKSRKQYTDEFKSEALKLAAQTTVASTAKQLGLHESQLYSWRAAQAKKSATSERENALAVDNAKLKRQLAQQAEELAIVKKAATYFAKNQK